MWINTLNLVWVLMDKGEIGVYENGLKGEES